MKKILSIFLAIAFGIFLGGCGILRAPTSVTLPARPLQTVKIFDAQTRKPMTNAALGCVIYRYTNWMNSFPRIVIGEKGGTNQNSGNIYLPAEPMANGVFKFSPVKKSGSTQIFFPLPFPTGWFLHRNYDGEIKISAPGYRTVRISDALARLSPKERAARGFFFINKEPKRDEWKKFVAFDFESTSVFLPHETE